MNEATDIQELIAELRENSQGFTEWRVQSPDGQSYCMHFEIWNGEAAANTWLANHRAEFPGSQFVDYLVAKAHVITQNDARLRRAADALEALISSEREVGYAQAIEFAQYVESHAKGEMVKAAKHFLSMPYSQALAKRITPESEAHIVKMQRRPFDANDPYIQAALVQLGWTPPAAPATEWTNETPGTEGMGGIFGTPS